jgi:predicted transcriptional regulator
MNQDVQGTIKSQVAEFIKNNPGLRACEIARGIGTKPSTAGTALTALLKSRQIGKVGKPGFYQYYPEPEVAAAVNFGISAGMKMLNDCLAGVRA